MKKVEQHTPYWFDRKQSNQLEDGLFAPIARGVANAMSTLVYSPDNLLINVSNKIVQMDAVLEKEKSIFGRLSNKITGDNLSCILLDGIVIQQLHDVIGIKTPIHIEIKYQYNVDHIDLRNLYARAGKIIAANKHADPPKDKLCEPYISVKRRNK